MFMDFQDAGGLSGSGCLWIFRILVVFLDLDWFTSLDQDIKVFRMFWIFYCFSKGWMVFPDLDLWFFSDVGSFIASDTKM